MKKTLLLTFTFAFCLAGFIKAQSLAFSTAENGELENGATIYVEMSPNAGEATQDFDIINKTSESIEVKVKKIEGELVENSMNTFCMAGSCFPPNVYETPNAVTIAGNGSYDGDFHVQYQPLSTIGTSFVTFVIFDSNNPTDSTYVYIHYISKNLTLSREDGEELHDGQEIIVHLTPDAGEIEEKIFVTNTSENIMLVQSKKVEVEVVPETINTFCWGQCFGPDVYESRDAVTVEGNYTNENDFSSHYNPNGQPGTSIITYTFYDDFNEQDSVSVTFKYTTETDGIEDINYVEHINAYPVPANDHLYIDFKIKNCKNISVRLTNILGEEIQHFQTNNNNNKILLNTSNINNGLYFYTIYSNNQPLITKKIIVKH